MERLRGRRMARMPLLLVFGALLAGSLFGCAFPTGEQEPEEQIVLATAVEQSAEEVLQPTATRTARPTATDEPAEPTATPTAMIAAPQTRLPTRTPRPTPTAAIAAGVPEGELATVTDVIDGDTIEVALDGEFFRVRYIGMDTPEQGAPFFAEATAANAALVAGKQVILVQDVSETDRFGRLLRYVYLLDGTFVNAELVETGFVQAATFPPDVAHVEDFLALEQAAREAGRGLWAQEQLAEAQTATLVPATAPVQATAEATQETQPTSAPTQPPATQAPTATSIPTPLPTQPPPTEPPAAAGEVVISFIFFDGAVSRVESDEYAEIRNVGGAPVNLAGWRLNAGDPGQDFSFPAYELGPGQSCRVYTNQVHSESCGFSFGRGSAIWNNDGDCGVLYDNTGAQVSRYCY